MLLIPVVTASRAVSPTTVLPALELAPLPIDIELKDPSELKVPVVPVTAWKVEIPEATFNPVVFPNILNPLAVTIPTESTLVTSSYVNVPPIDIVPGTVRSHHFY